MNSEPHPKEEPVTVFETTDPFAFTLAKGTLEDAGIEFAIAGDDTEERGLTGMSPAGGLGSKFQVAAESAATARELLEPLLDPHSIPAEENPAETEPEA